MSRARAWKLYAAVALPAAAFFGAAAALTAMLGQAGPFMWSEILGVAGAHDQRAYQILRGPSTPQSTARAATEIQRALALAPYDNAARLRLVYLDSRRPGGIGPQGLDAFARSYELMPYDYSVAAWRIRFGLEHWSSLTPDLRSAIFAEAMAFARVGSVDVDVPEVLQSIHDPEGRLAAALWLQALDQRPGVRRRKDTPLG
jgi:hypothetical protein